MTADRGRPAGCPVGLSEVRSSRTGRQESAEGIVGPLVRAEGLHGRAESSPAVEWRRAPGEAWDSGFDAWGELATGATGDDASVEVSIRPRLHLPNRRIRDPSVRWGGRGEAVRPLPIPIELTSGVTGDGVRTSVAGRCAVLDPD
jgi:hypothetical protein